MYRNSPIAIDRAGAIRGPEDHRTRDDIHACCPATQLVGQGTAGDLAAVGAA